MLPSGREEGRLQQRGRGTYEVRRPEDSSRPLRHDDAGPQGCLTKGVHAATASHPQMGSPRPSAG